MYAVKTLFNNRNWNLDSWYRENVLPVEDTVDSLHIPWQTGSHYLILAGSEEFKKWHLSATEY